ncbi:MAG: hypothetical protein AAB413_04320, partial [Patescibacteria group bacterium]
RKRNSKKQLGSTRSCFREIPNLKHQISNNIKNQIKKLKTKYIPLGVLDDVIWNLSGICDLKFGILYSYGIE